MWIHNFATVYCILYTYGIMSEINLLLSLLLLYLWVEQQQAMFLHYLYASARSPRFAATSAILAVSAV